MPELDDTDKAILAELLRETIERDRFPLAASDGDALAALFTSARSARNAWLAMRDRDTEV